jgi:hypothetical protein
LDDLKQLYDITWESIMEAPADKRSPLIGQMRALLVEIDQLQGSGDGEVPSNGLIDFQAALAERQQSKAKSSRSSSH